MIRGVVFDAGETLIDETRQCQTVADALGVPLFTLAAVLGGVIERREDHRRVFDVLGTDVVSAFDHGYRVDPRDFYPDALPTIYALRDAGYRVGIAGNGPEGMVEQLHELGLPFDLVASAATLGVSKPDPAFFARIGQQLALAPEQIAYVGDRLDNDVLPAQRAGMMGVFLRRGPWGYLHAGWPEASEVHHRIDDLTELSDVLPGFGRPM
jgi:HAD superfamily hydrolase (TIGR01662 family)